MTETGGYYPVEGGNVLIPEKEFLDLLSGRPVGVKTLRDEFAMASMQGQMIGNTQDPEWVARTAYRFADAMMKARENTNG